MCVGNETTDGHATFMRINIGRIPAAGSRHRQRRPIYGIEEEASSCYVHMCCILFGPGCRPISTYARRANNRNEGRINMSVCIHRRSWAAVATAAASDDDDDGLNQWSLGWFCSCENVGTLRLKFQTEEWGRRRYEVLGIESSERMVW